MMESVLGFIILKFILWIFPSRKIEDVSTVVASVELSIVGALPSKWRPEVHKSRVSLSYSWVYIYFDHVIRMSQESTSPVVLSS